MSENLQSGMDDLMHGNAEFMSEAVRIVDYDTDNNNILIRGSAAFGANVATTGVAFVFSDLITAIKKSPNYSSLPATISLANITQVIDFCLIGFRHDHGKDYGIVNNEAQWFSASPPALTGNAGPYPQYIASSNGNTAGMMVYWPIESIGYSPTKLLPTTAGESWPTGSAPSIKSSIEAANSGYNFAGLVPAIRSAVTNQVSSVLPGTLPAGISPIKDAIIYVHCDSGVNRTGAAIVGYLMNYGSKFLTMPTAVTPIPSGGPKYQLNQAQTAANSNPPGNDTSPAGGNDIWVAEAYCNYLCNNNNPIADLVTWAVPNPIPYQPPVS